mmetsp:Transcript_714/g.1573  ORF Transcript_714/g.1573 Transcript_714/m.1573 type:complete len:428 (-) Transcript_714:261-1544(-)
MLPDGKNPGFAKPPEVGLFNQPRDGRHVPVLHASHEDAGRCAPQVTLGQQTLNLFAVLHGGAQRLLAEDVLPGGNGLSQGLDVLEVRSADDEHVHKVAIDQILIGVEDGHARCVGAKLLESFLQGHLTGVCHSGDMQLLLQQSDVPDVLLPHCASADDTCAQALVAQGWAPQSRQHPPGRLKALPAVEHPGVVNYEDVPLLPREGHLFLQHKPRDGVQRLLVHRREVPQYHRLLPHVPGIVPPSESCDHGVEEDMAAGPLIHTQRRQDRGRGAAVPVGQPLPAGALLPHRLLGLLAGGHRIGLRPGPALGRARVGDLRHGADVAHTLGLHLRREVREALHEEVRHLVRWDDGSGAPLPALDVAAEEDVARRSWGLRQLVVEGDGLVRRRLVGGKDHAFHYLRTRRCTTHVVIAFTAHGPCDLSKVLS